MTISPSPLLSQTNPPLPIPYIPFDPPLARYGDVDDDPTLVDVPPKAFEVEYAFVPGEDEEEEEEGEEEGDAVGNPKEEKSLLALLFPT